MSIPFKDMHGNDVTVGDRIKIVSCYCFNYREGNEAEVIWREDKGMYNYRIKEMRRGKEFIDTNDFYTIHKFELIKK